MVLKLMPCRTLSNFFAPKLKLKTGNVPLETPESGSMTTSRTEFVTAMTPTYRSPP